jgi:hypothetical protein
MIYHERRPFVDDHDAERTVHCSANAMRVS